MQDFIERSYDGGDYQHESHKYFLEDYCSLNRREVSFC